MPKKIDAHGGGARTNANGLAFEQQTSLNDALTAAGYTVFGVNVIKNGQTIGLSLPKKKLYTEFLTPNGIDYRDYNSKVWEPDEAFLNYQNRTLYVIEKKFQKCAGSVDEKLPNCHFKKQEYQKLMTPLDYKVEFLYVLSDWFQDSRYRDTLQYVVDMGCLYYFNQIPLEILELT